MQELAVSIQAKEAEKSNQAEDLTSSLRNVLYI